MRRFEALCQWVIPGQGCPEAKRARYSSVTCGEEASTPCEEWVGCDKRERKKVALAGAGGTSSRRTPAPLGPCPSQIKLKTRSRQNHTRMIVMHTRQMILSMVSIMVWVPFPTT